MKVLVASIAAVCLTALVVANRAPYLSYSASVFYGGRHFSSEYGKVSAALVGQRAHYNVTLTPRAETFRNNTHRDYHFSAPVGIENVTSVVLSWAPAYRKPLAKLYVKKITLNPKYKGRHYPRTYCPPRHIDGIRAYQKVAYHYGSC